ncbi:tyrosine-type recombinase/integrase [Dactylosporangium darangshiense]|uniref:Tyr recombinase domain-containing protein n=1 Tax=Dactylosporangium darangshiense TaxID=579108 RepID=A0ABP8DPX2_9ACTN
MSDSFTKRLRYLIAAAGLSPVRPHDLRHGAASLAHITGADLKTVQDQLGRASIVLTADTYTSVLPATHHKSRRGKRPARTRHRERGSEPRSAAATGRAARPDPRRTPPPLRPDPA